MSYTDDFKKILSKRENVRNANMFVLRNNNPRTIKVFPSEVSSVLLGKYFDSLSDVLKEKEFVEYIPTTIEKGTLQVIKTSSLTLWSKMMEARNGLECVNLEDITVDDYRCDGNTILMEIQFEQERIFFLTTYRNVAAWYSNNIRFTKRQQKFHEEKGDILALSPWVDAVISGERCYIINEVNFNKIFKFSEVIERQISEHKNEICNLNFIGDGEDFMNRLEKSVRQKNAMAKAIMQNRLEKMQKFGPKYIRKQIRAQKELSFINFTEDDRIVIDDKSFKAVVGILCGNINLDLITKELNGIDEK